MKSENRLLQLSFFENVTPETVNYIWKHGKTLTFGKGQVFIHAKSTVDYIYFQISGKSIIYNLTHHGEKKIIFILGSGNLLNENVLNSAYSSTFCETIEHSEIFAISNKKFFKIMEQDFSLTKAVLESQERKLWRMSHQLKNTMGSIYMERKLAAKLWKLSRDFGVITPDGIEIDINLTITFLADLLGAPRETTSRLCKTLTDYGLMKMEKRRITIIDPDKMSYFYKKGTIPPESI